MLSLTAASGRPTMIGFSKPASGNSNSTSHKIPSIPSNVTEYKRASIAVLLSAFDSSGSKQAAALTPCCGNCRFFSLYKAHQVCDSVIMLRLKD
jgi:hypothetical protein